MTIEKKSASQLIDRYLGYSSEPRSAEFKTVVDMMVAYMVEYRLAPDEIRDAAFVASIKFLQMRPARQLVYERDDMRWPVPSENSGTDEDRQR